MVVLRAAKDLLVRLAAPATAGLLLCLGATPALAQSPRDPRTLNTELLTWGRAHVRVSAHATYGVLVQVDAPDAGSLAFLLRPDVVTAWTEAANQSIAAATSDAAIALPPLGDDAGSLAARAVPIRGRPALALVASDALVRRRVVIEVARAELATFVLAANDAASTVRDYWSTPANTVERLPVFGTRVRTDRLPEGGDRRPPYPESLSGQPRRQGFALIGIRVDSAGRVDEQSIDQLAASESEFMRTAINFIGGQRFRPGERLGRPVAMRTMVQWLWNQDVVGDVREFVVPREVR
ncbi:MAG: hypothetical protein HYX65_03055 [Gemmatimonadetes bacterium]|nr:hypothetical protein [Gemmatimonadota bacterium]